MAAPALGAGAASGGAGCSGGGGAGAGAGSGSEAAGAGGRLPSWVLELVFSYLELSELRSCALVCKHWYRCLHGDENSECQGYVALLGSDDQSWGWNLVDNNLLHNGEVNGSFPQCNNAPKYQIGERIRVILDMEDKTLAFERGYEFLGVAFRGLPKVCLYPAVSAVYGNTEVTLVYLGKPLDG
ncbi:FBXO45 isoform 2 [Pongo abelii]|uniref:FBXO45 isoform 2 n=1 Tax=Pongo abelii TaxID=9601 RepID=A0A2J8R085_PONAB|nr:FBXO45 isoform 2 [Pongo abelii]